MNGIPVAFIGLGAMGAPMARNLIKAGFDLRCWNRSPGRAAALSDAGARVCASIEQAVAGARFVVSIVADDSATRAVMLGASGAVEAAGAGTVILDSSTNTPALSREVAQAARQRGVSYVDAPVAGSVPQAQSGELVFMVGGDPDAVGAVKPLLEAMGRQTVVMGPSGTGTTIKLINNMLSGAMNAAIGEAVAVAQAAGLDGARVTELLNEGPVGSRLTRTKLPKIFKRDFSPQFQLGLMEKDLRYFLALAQELDCPVPLAALARAQLQAARRAGCGELDVCSVFYQVVGERPARS
ncbi:MAG: NAD(P)-dependent oxidoreductase [Betaproteobacteria bacterium]|jgi:3-hydroxyisobutyrate dehydrogenase